MDKEVIDKAIEFIKSSQCKYDGWDKLFEICRYIYNLEQRGKKQQEIIDKAIKYINENVYEEDNGCGDYWWEIADKDELLKILEDKEVSE